VSTERNQKYVHRQLRKSQSLSEKLLKTSHNNTSLQIMAFWWVITPCSA